MHVKSNKFLHILFMPMIKFCDYLGKKNPLLLTQLRYFERFHKFIDFRNPKTINEKIQWLKLKSDISEWTRVSDKYLVRDYIKECGCENNLVTLYGKWDNANQIDFDLLPDSFVAKANNGCGSVLIVEDKQLVNVEVIREKLNTWISTPFGADGGEIQYLLIKPCIIVEELLKLDTKDRNNSTSLIDYKIWCFNGRPQYIMTCTNREKTSVELLVYDLAWNVVPNSLKPNKTDRLGTSIPRPVLLDEMLAVASKLAQPFPCVRVDLYCTDGKVYFGEMTFTSLGGMMDYYTPEFLLKLGNEIDLEYKL